MKSKTLMFKKLLQDFIVKRNLKKESAKFKFQKLVKKNAAMPILPCPICEILLSLFTFFYFSMTLIFFQLSLTVITSKFTATSVSDSYNTQVNFYFCPREFLHMN